MPPDFDALDHLYTAFDRETTDFRREAACARGCAYCCTEAGRIDCTTLEALRIHGHVGRWPRPRRLALQKALARDRRLREEGRPSPCPFIGPDAACTIYDLRPFACRRIYSLRRCTPEGPPLLSRRAMAVAEGTIAGLRRLDANGYSGHLSFILHLLASPRFLATYRAGEFRPGEILAFGQSHGLAINRMATGPWAPPPAGALSQDRSAG